jgi:catechol 2,3-dioxygenase
LRSLAHIGHVELLTPSPQESLRCFTDVLGMRELHRAGDSVYLRGDGEYEQYGLKLKAAKHAGLGHVAIRARGPKQLDAVVARLVAAGVNGRWTDGDFGHGAAFRFTGPGGGHDLELYWESERFIPPSTEPLTGSRPLGLYGGPGVNVRRLDHLNLLAADPAAAAAFAHGQLGFAEYDRLHDDAGALVGSWLSLGSRPIELVYTQDPLRAQGRLHHLAFWVDTREDVLRAADVFVDHEVPIEVPPAQHTIGGGFFLYGFEPGGNRIEVTTAAQLVIDPDPDTRIWTASQRQAGVGWGTVFPPSWHDYGTPDLAAK